MRTERRCRSPRSGACSDSRAWTAGWFTACSCPRGRPPRERRGGPGSRTAERGKEFLPPSSRPVRPLYTQLDAEFDYAAHLGNPGDYPFTRGIHPTMYRGRLWTMRMFSGFGSPEDTNAPFQYLI